MRPFLALQDRCGDRHRNSIIHLLKEDSEECKKMVNKNEKKYKVLVYQLYL